MLKIKGNKLEVVGINFSLPQDFYIDIEDMEGIHPNGLTLLSPEEDCYISFMTTEVEFETPVKSLLDIFVDNVLDVGIQEDMTKTNKTGYIWIEEPQMSELNGLKCAYVKYETPNNYCYEIHFERLGGYDRQLEVLLVISKEYNVDLDVVLSRKNVSEFYRSIEVSKDW